MAKEIVEVVATEFFYTTGDKKCVNLVTLNPDSVTLSDKSRGVLVSKVKGVTIGSVYTLEVDDEREKFWPGSLKWLGYWDSPLRDQIRTEAKAFEAAHQAKLNAKSKVAVAKKIPCQLEAVKPLHGTYLSLSRQQRIGLELRVLNMLRYGEDIGI